MNNLMVSPVFVGTQLPAVCNGVGRFMTDDVDNGSLNRNAGFKVLL